MTLFLPLKNHNQFQWKIIVADNEQLLLLQTYTAVVGVNVSVLPHDIQKELTDHW